MFYCSLCSTRALANVVSWCPNKTQLRVDRNNFSRSQRPVGLLEIRMASNGQQQFPPQKRDTQPGKEHVMNPIPQFSNPDCKPSNKLQGMMALVTGGDSGIGQAVCHCFVLEGATVAFTYGKSQEDKDALHTLEMPRKDKTPDARDPMAISADLGKDKNCKQVVEEVAKAFGRIDILVNNAAEQHKASCVEEIDEERLEKVFRINIFSQFFMVRHALKHMKEGSSIINTTSINAYKGMISYLITQQPRVQLWLSL